MNDEGSVKHTLVSHIMHHILQLQLNYMTVINMGPLTNDGAQN